MTTRRNLAAGPRSKKRTRVLAYGAAIAIVVGATVLRLALTPLIGETAIPFITFLPAILFAAWYGGFRVGALCIFLSTFAADYFFVPPVGTFLITNAGHQISLLIFVFVGFGIALLSHSQRQALARAQRAETSERDQRQWFETTLASIGDAVIATDARGRVTFMNAAAQSLIGWTREETAGMPLEKVLVISNAETGAVAEDPVSRVLQEGRIVGLANHTRLTAKGGRQIPIEHSAAPIAGVEGSITGVVLVFRDVTERVEAERRIHMVVEAAPNAMVMVGSDGRIALVNSQAEKLFGYGREELLGQLVEVLVPERYRNSHSALRGSFSQAASARAMGAGRDLFGLRKDGSEVPIEIGLNPICTDQGDFVLAAIIDITERKRAVDTLRSNEQRLATMMKYLPVGVGVIDSTGHVLVFNPLWRRFLKGDVPSRDDKEDTKWRAWHADGRPLERHNYPAARALRGEEVIPGIEFLHTDENGVETWTRVSAVPFLGGPDRQITGALTLIQDIDDERRAANALRQIAQELRASNEALLRANDDLKQFAFAASHDLQEPLRMITSYSQLLLSGLRGAVEGEAAVCVKFISQGTTRMRDLLVDLLAYTQVSAEEKVSFEPIDLNLVAEKAVGNLKSAIEDGKAAVTVDPLPVVRGHDAHFLQLFQNLLGNAVKYRSERLPRIHVSAVRKDGSWRVSVSDNGIGIDPKYHGRIFGVFKRLHGKSIPGTGIGLAICQRVVEGYGGRIWVESQLGHGATFHFTLPASEGDPHEC